MPSTTIVGNAAYITWGGTVLSTQYRTLTETESGETVDGSAGSDTFKCKIYTLADGSVSLDIVALAGGTANIAALALGNSGTLIYGEEGTATNKPKTTVNAVISSRKRTIPYDGVIAYSVDFDFTAAPTHGVWP